MGQKLRGFTLIEILVVLAIVMAAGFAALTFSIPQLQASQTESLMNDMSSLVFLYQQDAQSGKNGKSYGARFENNSYIMFVGDSFATAESSSTINYPADTSTSEVSFEDGGREIVFSPNSFRPSTRGTVKITNGIDIFVLSVNREGLIYIYKQ